MEYTYAHFYEQAYFGRACTEEVDALGNVRLRRIPPQRGQMARYAIPSFHFGNLLAPFIDDFEQHKDFIMECAANASKNLATLGASGAAILTENEAADQSHLFAMLSNGADKTDIAVAIIEQHDETPYPKGVWVFPAANGAYGKLNSSIAVAVASVGLHLLANPDVVAVMRFEDQAQPPGMKSTNAGRIKRGETPIPPMRTIHLTKRVYVDGRPVGGERGSHASPEPHDRKGHYRHSKRAIPGWQGPVVESTGEWAGVECYRRWIDDVKINGGAPKPGPGHRHPKTAQPNAPQYRVVK